MHSGAVNRGDRPSPARSLASGLAVLGDAVGRAAHRDEATGEVAEGAAGELDAVDATDDAVVGEREDLDRARDVDGLRAAVASATARFGAVARAGRLERALDVDAAEVGQRVVADGLRSG